MKSSTKRYLCSGVLALLGVTKAESIMAGAPNPDRSTWAQQCFVRNQYDGDLALAAFSTGTIETQAVGVESSGTDTSLTQQWNVIPDTTSPGLWYLMVASSASLAQPLCATVQNAQGQGVYLDYCSLHSPNQEYRIGIAYAATRYMYHIYPSANYSSSGGPNQGLITASYTPTSGNQVLQGPLDAAAVSGVDPSLIAHMREIWSVEGCLDADSNPIVFGSGWATNGGATGY